MTDIRGTEIFARYAYAPNQLGYCGPSESTALREGSPEQVWSAARRFSGAWPYLRVMAEMTGIADPLDHRLVESYWLGGGLGAQLDTEEFTAALLAVIAPLAGHYWAHLTADLAAEAAPNHCFHVFGVYPWSRLLGRGMDEHPIHVLDSCRIGWGTVLRRDGDDLSILGRGLVWDQEALRLSEPSPRHARIDGFDAAPRVRTGDQVAVHWGRLCDRLTSAQVYDLAASTERQLLLTNRRLRRESATAPGAGAGNVEEMGGGFH
ncbi:hypothetical protein GFY24_13270 [Nocardia sp. SYP-A9097]|uniref:DUF6390 family protein n=1 Tax=Nocardia sp. SYP-A9097 TaxID=2663237 RepID=UPI00129AC0BD|nr:DUF6390 family protein [Nocardia sp. SYP-A9097]MRH88404.1 hypothetical protein [Nocardia sp. SYP-A9097]